MKCLKIFCKAYDTLLNGLELGYVRVSFVDDLQESQAIIHREQAMVNMTFGYVMCGQSKA